jgi:YspA, cpYpsA-related SLOG family
LERDILMRILACGSRDWTKRTPIKFALRQYGGDDCLANTLIHGNARGADLIAASVAFDMGWGHE